MIFWQKRTGIIPRHIIPVLPALTIFYYLIFHVFTYPIELFFNFFINVVFAFFAPFTVIVAFLFMPLNALLRMVVKISCCDCDLFQILATGECFIANLRYTPCDRDICQIFVTLECLARNRCYFIGNTTHLYSRWYGKFFRFLVCDLHNSNSWILL